MSDAHRAITADLCDLNHRFFYFQDDRKSCPYCQIKRIEASNELLETVYEAAKLSQNYGPDSTDLEWDEFWRGLEKALAAVQTRQDHDDDCTCMDRMDSGKLFPRHDWPCSCGYQKDAAADGHDPIEEILKDTPFTMRKTTDGEGQ